MTDYNSFNIAELVSDSYRKGLEYAEKRILRLLQMHMVGSIENGKSSCVCQASMPMHNRQDYQDHIAWIIKSESLMDSTIGNSD